MKDELLPNISFNLGKWGRVVGRWNNTMVEKPHTCFNYMKEKLCGDLWSLASIAYLHG